MNHLNLVKFKPRGLWQGGEIVSSVNDKFFVHRKLVVDTVVHGNNYCRSFYIIDTIIIYDVYSIREC